MTFIPMPWPKTVCRTCLCNQRGQSEVRRTRVDRGMGMNVTAQFRVNGAETHATPCPRSQNEGGVLDPAGRGRTEPRSGPYINCVSLWSCLLSLCSLCLVCWLLWLLLEGRGRTAPRSEQAPAPGRAARSRRGGALHWQGSGVNRRRENLVGVNLVLAEYHQIQAWLL